MKIRLVEKLNEGMDDNLREHLLEICKLIGAAHDKIMEAQDELSNVKYDYDEEILDDVEYALDDLEASLSEMDFMGSDGDPVEDLKDHFE